MPRIKYLQNPDFVATRGRIQLHKLFLRKRHELLHTEDHGKQDALIEELEFIQAERRIQCPNSFVRIIRNINRKEDA